MEPDKDLIARLLAELMELQEAKVSPALAEKRRRLLEKLRDGTFHDEPTTPSDPKDSD